MDTINNPSPLATALNGTEPMDREYALPALLFFAKQERIKEMIREDEATLDPFPNRLPVDSYAPDDYTSPEERLGKLSTLQTLAAYALEFVIVASFVYGMTQVAEFIINLALQA